MAMFTGCASEKYVVDHSFDGITSDEFFFTYGSPDWPPYPTNGVIKDYNSHCIFTPSGVIRRSNYKIRGKYYRLYWKPDTNLSWYVLSGERIEK